MGSNRLAARPQPNVGTTSHCDSSEPDVIVNRSAVPDIKSRPLPSSIAAPPPLPDRNPGRGPGAAAAIADTSLFSDDFGNRVAHGSSTAASTASSTHAPTIIRAPRGAQPKPRTESSYSSMEQQGAGAVESEAHSVTTNTQRHSFGGRVAGGIRVLPFDGQLSLNKGMNTSTTKPKPMVKPKPSLMPKPALRPKSTTSTPSATDRTSAFASSLKFAQMLESGAPKPVEKPPETLTSSNRPTDEFNEQQNQSASTRKAPMKATYRPTIIRAAIKTTDSVPPPRTDDSTSELFAVHKRLSASCMNVSSHKPEMKTVEFGDDWQTASAVGSEPPPKQAQPVKRLQPTVIRARVNKSSPQTDSLMNQESSTLETGQHDVTKETVQPKPRPRSFHGSMMSSALSMPHIATFSQTSNDDTFRPPATHNSVSKHNSPGFSPVSDTQPVNSPVMEPAKKAPPPRPAEGPKKPPRPAEGPKRR